MWVAYAPVAVFLSRQCLYRDLEWSFVWVIVMALIAIAARLFVRRPILAKYSDDNQVNNKPRGGKTVEAPKRGRFATALIYIVLPAALLGVGFYVSVSDTNRLKQMVLEHLDVQRAIVKDLQEDRLDIERALKYKDSPWRHELNLSLQITQNYATDNWYQGGVNAFAMLAGVKGMLSYKKKNLSWESVGEWRAGVSTISGDSLRIVNTTDDVFRINSKFGYQIHKHWYISTIAEFRTNLMNNWRKNTRQV
jgi:hypothetical protein